MSHEGRRRIPIPCPDGIPGCAVAHYQLVNVTAKIVQPPVVQSEVVLTMDMETASFLRSLICRIAGNARYARTLHLALRDAGVCESEIVEFSIDPISCNLRADTRDRK